MRASVPSIEEYVDQIVDEAPPLTPEQRSRLSALLRPAQRADAEDAA